MPEIIRPPKKGAAGPRVWTAAALLAGIGMWLALSRMPKGSEWAPSGEEAAYRDTEQSLHSLDAAENPQGAPGRSLASASGGAYALRDRSTQAASLYQPAGGPAEENPSDLADSAGSGAGGRGTGSSAPGGPIAASAAAPGTAGKGTAPAAAGWGGKPVIRLKSRAELARLEGLGSGGGSSAAQWNLVEKPFGTGGDPGLRLSRVSAGAPARARDAEAAGSGPGGSSMSSLSRARKLSAQALVQGDEAAVGTVRRAFDAGGGRATLKQMALQGAAAAGLAGGGEVPINLKAGDPGASTVKSFEPPAVGEAGKVEDDGNDEYMQQQILMMIMGVSIAGIFGPAISGMGLAISRNMGLDPPSEGSLDVEDGRPPASVGG